MDGRKLGSIRIEAGCKATVCTKAYFLGTCHLLESSANNLEQVISDVGSANCTCERKCSCQDVVVPRDFKTNGFAVRAYLKGGCNTCDTEYIKLPKKAIQFLTRNLGAVDSIAIPKGCEITIWPLEKQQGEPTRIDEPTQEFKGPIGSYGDFQCGDSEEEQNIDHSLPKNEQYPPMVDLAAKIPEFREQIKSNITLVNHPGAKMALDSLKSKRSHKNAYVIFIGARIPYWLGFPQCRNKNENKIWECRMKAHMDHVGLSGEFRLIIVPSLMFNLTNHEIKNTLEKFMSTHEELKDVIPNAVIVYHYFSHNYEETAEQNLNQKLETVHTLRHILLDESFSNVVYLLDNLDELSEADQRNPQESIERFKQQVKKWSFPSPIIAVPRADADSNQRFVNGYFRMKNQEYFPMNLENSLVNICEKGRDPLGREILKAVFGDRHATHFDIEPIIHDV